jgi:hypothetical protein
MIRDEIFENILTFKDDEQILEETIFWLEELWEESSEENFLEFLENYYWPYLEKVVDDGWEEEVPFFDTQLSWQFIDDYLKNENDSLKDICLNAILKGGNRKYYESIFERIKNLYLRSPYLFLLNSSEWERYQEKMEEEREEKLERMQEKKESLSFNVKDLVEKVAESLDLDAKDIDYIIESMIHHWAISEIDELVDFLQSDFDFDKETYDSQWLETNIDHWELFEKWKVQMENASASNFTMAEIVSCIYQEFLKDLIPIVVEVLQSEDFNEE